MKEQVNTEIDYRNYPSEAQKGKRTKKKSKKQRADELLVSIKLSNTCTIEIPEGKKKNGAKETLEEIVAKYFLEVMKDISPWIQGTQWTLRRITEKTQAH